MNKRINLQLIKITTLIFLFHLILFSNPESLSAEAQTFLNPIYYGFINVSAIFDHEYPYTVDQGSTHHYDGTTHNPPFNNDWGYSGHAGIDYDLNYKPVIAASNGQVAFADWANTANHTSGLGLRVEIEHSNGYTTLYGHLNAISVSVGNSINPNIYAREGIIGISGGTGNSDGTHLHFGVKKNSNNRAVNPYGWISSSADPWANHPNGETSTNLWINRPALTTNQYPSGSGITEPVLPFTSGSLDDSSSTLFSHTA